MVAHHIKHKFLLRALSGNLIGDPSESVRAWLNCEDLYVQRDHVRGEGFAYYVEARNVRADEAIPFGRSSAISAANVRMKRLMAALRDGERKDPAPVVETPAPEE